MGSRSKDVQAKIGFDDFRAILIYPRNRWQHPTELAKPLELFEDFNSLCQTTEATGLVCLARVTALLAARFPQIDVGFESGDIPMTINANLSKPNIGLTALVSSFAKDGFIEVSIRIPKQVDLEFSLGKHLIVSAECRVILYGHFRQDSFSQARDDLAIQISTFDELSILTRLTSTIVRGIVKGVNFDSFEAVPHLLAEGVLRTIEFPSPSIIIHGVRVVIRLPEDSPLGTCEIIAEKSRGHGISTASDEVLPKAYAPPSFSQTTDAAVNTSSLDNQSSGSSVQDTEVHLPVEPDHCNATADSTTGAEERDGISASEPLTEDSTSNWRMRLSYMGKERLHSPLIRV